MSDTRDITPEQRQSILSKLNKLLRTEGTTEAEASSRIAKAQELLAQYNLTMDDVEREGGDGGKRADQKLTGGFYKWERELWGSVAELNFCWYLPWWTYVEEQRKNKWGDTHTHDRRVYQHRLIGREVNIAQTKAMASYLIQVTRRLCRERLHGDNAQMLSSWAVSFQEGVAARVCEKLGERRQQVLSEERERERAAAKMAMQGASTATGLTLARLSQTEKDANHDFVLGEGWTAKQAAARAENARIRAMNEAEFTQWAAAHPKEAAERERKARAARRSYSRGGGAQERSKDWGAYRAGYEDGDSVGIDTQAGQKKTAGLL